MDAANPKYKYQLGEMRGCRVGQAVKDILSTEHRSYTAGEIMEAWAPKYIKDLEQAIENGANQFQGIFYVFVLTSKEMWTDNVVRNWFVARQTAPYATDMINGFPNRTKTLYMVDPEKGRVKLVWTIPGVEEARSLLSNPGLYDPDLVSWTRDAFQGKLDLEHHSF